MNKGDLVDAVAGSTGDSKSGAAASLDAVLDAITSALKGGDKVQISGFGTFEVRARAARQGGATIQIKASNAPAFKAGKALKEAVN